LLFFRLDAILPFAVFNRCVMYSASTLAISCPEHARLESEFIEARDRMRGLVRLRNLSPAEERQLAVRVAMTIARLKEHVAEHGCERRG
jgi:hypothetical protein